MKIIQISDTHLFADDMAEMRGVKCNIKFKEVVERIATEDNVDLIFLTGDVSQDETMESYQIVSDELSKLNLPVYWIPGNHDNILRMYASLDDKFHRQSHLSTPNWQFIFLDTKINKLSPAELKLLREQIEASSEDKKIAIVMHHHPAPVGTPFIDRYILENPEPFWEIVKGTNVELIICGHVHNDYSFQHHGVMIESAPATCLQWKKGITTLDIDFQIGYKVYHFDKDGYRANARMW